MHFNLIPLPIAGFGTPGKDDLKDVVARVIICKQSGPGVVVHCSAEQAERGNFMSLLAMTLTGLKAEEAIAWTRQYIKEQLKPRIRKCSLRFTYLSEGPYSQHGGNIEINFQVEAAVILPARTLLPRL